MATITVQQNSLFMLEWELPDQDVVNVFVSANGDEQEFAHPSPKTASAERVEIRLTLTDPSGTSIGGIFFKNRDEPLFHKDKRTHSSGRRVPMKIFRAEFMARHLGTYAFEILHVATNTTTTETMKVVPMVKRFLTIESVLNDKTAVRRHAVLAAVADFFPAFNTGSPSPSGLKVGDQTKNLCNQGPWQASYHYPAPPGSMTSCTTVNPMQVMKVASLPNNASAAKWAFGASSNPGWVDADRDKLPNVGDTYIVANEWVGGPAHVGIVVHVPRSGNGLWVTADGGQATRPAQYAILVPRWGLLGEMLPFKGGPNHPYPKMKPKQGDPPFLSGAYKGNLVHSASVPTTDNDHPDIPGIIDRLVFSPTNAAGVKPSNPRRLNGFVDIDSPKLSFGSAQVPIDPQFHAGSPPTNIDPTVVQKIKKLQGRVDAVIEATEKGEYIIA